MRQKSMRVTVVTRVGAALAAILAASGAQAQQTIVSAAQVQPAQGQTFRTLPGFVVEKLTPDAGPTYLEPVNPLTPGQAPSVSTNLIIITFDEQGRPWVSPSASMRGSAPQLLVDADRDGVYEAMKPFTQQMNTCHGLWWESSTTLYCVGFGPKQPDDHWTTEFGAPDFPDWQAGLYRAIDTTGDDVADRVERVVPFQSGMFDHGPHRVLRAADGSIQVILGNVGPPTETSTNLDSILTHYRERDFIPRMADRWGKTTMQSSIVRVDTLTNRVQVIEGGHRNAVGFTWNLLGETFFFDSDMEPEIGTPWYRQIRSYHGVPNADFGFRNGSNKWPMDYFDILPPVRELNRGSPTGVASYQAWAYPAEFRDVIFEADYSMHRILYSQAAPSGATYTMRSDSATFVSGVGNNLAVTDIEVGPDGMLYFTLNGVNGGLYRVRYTGPPPAQPDLRGIYAVTRQAQPLSSWGYEAIERVKGSMGANAFRAALEGVARNRNEPSEDRFRALLEMNRHGVPASVQVLRALSTDPDQQVRATVVLLAGLERSAAAKALAESMLRDADALVRRRAIEAVLAQGLVPATASPALTSQFYGMLSDPDRFVRYAARWALERTPRTAWRSRALAETSPRVAFPALLALNNTATSEADRSEIYARVIHWLEQPTLEPEHRLSALRMFEIAAWDRVGGAPAAVRQRVRDLLLPQFAAQTPRLKLEMTKVLAYTASSAGLPADLAVGMPEVIYLRSRASAETNGRMIDAMLAAMPANDTTTQMDYVNALRLIKFGWTAPQKERLIDWFGSAVNWLPTTRNYTRTMWTDWSSVLTAAERTAATTKYPALVPPAGGGGFGGGGGGAGGGGGQGRGGGGGAPAGGGGAPGGGAPASAAPAGGGAGVPGNEAAPRPR